MKRKTFSSRLLAILMTVALVLSFASVSASAEGETNDQEDTTRIPVTQIQAESCNEVTADQLKSEYGITLTPESTLADKYRICEVPNGQMALIKQNNAFAILFGEFGNMTDQEIRDNILKKIDDDSFYQGQGSTTKIDFETVPCVQIEDGLTVWSKSDDPNWANEKNNVADYYYFYKGETVSYIIAPSGKVSHFDVFGNEKHSIPDVKKEVSVDNGTSYSTEVSTATGDANTVTFKLTTNVPETTSTTEILIHDQMADKFTGPDASNDFTVTLDRDGTENDKDLASYITFEASPDDGCTFHLTINVDSAKQAGVIENSDFGKTPIVITYTAYLAEGTAAGVYTNTAWTQETSKSTVTVDTYGIQIFKYDGSTVGEDSSLENATGLEGAEFALYSSDDVTVTNDKATVNQDATPIWTGSSGTNGYVTINGLAEGTYYLVETETPTGYTGASEPISVTVSKEAAGTDYTVDVNVANTKTPTTGGAGTMFYTFGGLAIVAAAGVVFLASRKSRKQSA